MRHRLSILAILLCIALPLSAAEIPATPAGAALDEWIAILKADDEAGMRTHHAERLNPDFSAQFAADQYVVICRQLAGVVAKNEITSIVEKSPNLLSAFFDTGSGWFELLLEVEPDAPHRVSGLLVRPAEAPGNKKEAVDAPPFPASGSLEEMLRYAKAQGGFPAVAGAHWKGGKLNASHVIGLGSVNAETSLDADARFHIGSVTKSVTATMIGRLVDQKKLSWDMTIGKQLADIEMREEYKPVTLQQLLRHRGGIAPGTAFNEEQLNRWATQEGSSTEQREAYVRHTLNEPPVAKVGEQMIYSNGGYTIVALIAERATKKSWSELIQQEVFTPLKLSSAGFGWPAESQGHVKQGDRFEAVAPADYDLGDFMDPAGDVHMTVADLARYAGAHLAALNGDESYLKPETIKQLHTPPAGGDYASGWIVMDVKGDKLHWHNGSVGTYYAFVGIFPESDEAFAFLFNAAPGAEEFSRQIGMALHGRE